MSLKSSLTDVMPSPLYIRLLYLYHFGKLPHLRNPRTFNEKLQWLKLHDHNPIYTTMVDKVRVKEYVTSLAGAKYIIPNLGATKLEDLQTPLIQRFYNNLLKPRKPGVAPLAPKTVRCIHGIFHSALSKAVQLGYLRSNPSDACELPRAIRKEIVPLEDEQIAVFLKAIEGHTHEYLYKIALFTGMREGEVLGLTWDCIDFKRGTLVIRRQLVRDREKGGEYHFSTPKNGKMRVIALPQTVIELFAAQRNKQTLMMLDAGKAWENNNLIFTNPTGGYLSYRTVYDCFKRVVKKIGFPNTRFHDLRHTYAVVAIKSGDDIKTVQENLGHATAAFTLDIYGHVTEQMKHASADRMEAFIHAVSH